MRQRLGQELRRLESADAFEALGVDYRANAAAIRAAFLELTKQFHPSRFARRDMEVVRLANEVFLRIKAAYTTIATDVSRDRQLARLGRAPTEAVPVVPPARQLAEPPAPSNRDGRSSKPAARTRSPSPRPAPAVAKEIPGGDTLFQDAMDLCKRHLWADARAAFQKLAVQEPQNRQYRAHMHYAWGREHIDLGRTDDARAEFRRALTADPQFTRAQHALDTLPEAEKPKDRGFFSRLFRK